MKEQQLENTPAYKAGYEAQKHGVGNSDNPHPMGSASGMNVQRYQWYMGWYDSKFEAIYKV